MSVDLSEDASSNAIINNVNILNKWTKKRAKYFHPQFSARIISEYPYILKIKNLLIEDEIDSLLEMAKHKFEKSNILKDGVLLYTDQRTSSTAYIFTDGLPDKYDLAVERMIKRIRKLMACEREQLEIMCVRYKMGEYFEKHVDYFFPHEINSVDNAGQRIATFFVYLNTVEGDSGGETEFTKLGIKSKPKKGDALFWWNRDPKTGKMLPQTEHRGNPITKNGVIKYGLNIWIRSNSF